MFFSSSCSLSSEITAPPGNECLQMLLSVNTSFIINLLDSFSYLSFLKIFFQSFDHIEIFSLLLPHLKRLGRKDLIHPAHKNPVDHPV